MTTDATDSPTIDVPIRVRYRECDPMGVAHHSVYAIWMEIARTDLLRKQGIAYRDLEAEGVFFVVARMSQRFRRPAKYDDDLTITATALPSAGVKLEHEYTIRRGKQLLATATTTLACVDAEGKLRPAPPELLTPKYV